MEGIAMTRHRRLLHLVLLGVLALGLGAVARAQEFAEARIFIEYNSTDNDLGFHVFLDGEDWRSLQIINPNGRQIFTVTGKGAFGRLGLTELFFEGAEPSLDEVPLDELLAQFPEGQYRFVGKTVEGEDLESTAMLTHAVPAGPRVSARADDDSVIIRWRPVAGPPAGFPMRRVRIVAFQIIVGSFQVTLPSSSRQVTLPREFVRRLAPGEYEFEVLAIEAGGNQTITSGSFVITEDDD
jgi:hypothetical protein